MYVGRAIAQGVSRRLPTAAARFRERSQVMWDLWRTKWHWGRFSQRTSVSAANLQQLLHNYHHLSSEAGKIGHQWPQYQVDSVSPHPPLRIMKKKNKFKQTVLQLRRSDSETQVTFCGTRSGRSGTEGVSSSFFGFSLLVVIPSLLRNRLPPPPPLPSCRIILLYAGETVFYSALGWVT
jgi:hypothetical protein